ncbi:FAS1-like dehydratase domain-containing protein [Gordonia hydrophobica]|uniref:MaoC family dehydratase N-terminal domain-containing protein n=1 Tax=Gordonia hydrophobica TaxID=40516 RepID=A0ABZ2U5K6_9ACTN|nr:MaoC family dehydratase N-terminal domain-containing protein [Gordonia hydrophobica]MBM7365707.1 3-methylfumaryl-CoA hydratase [Gordonia hydrophobica]
MTDWQPHTVTTTEVVDPGRVRAVARLFDDALPAPAVGDPLPPLWHWAALPEWAPSGELGLDGHPRRGSFLPPIDLPRRMFAGGSVEFPGTVRVGDTIHTESIVESVTEKHGRSGQLTVVVVSTTIFDGDGSPAVVEKQNLIYREAAPRTTASAAEPEPAAEFVPVGSPLVPAGTDRWDFRTDPTLLMSFSAATANAHRIHYDWPYATRVEGYPGLVVHGPLMTMSLAQTHRLRADGTRIASLTHRNLKPLFCGDAAQLVFTAVDAGARVELVGDDGAAHTAVELTFDQ